MTRRKASYKQKFTKKNKAPSPPRLEMKCTDFDATTMALNATGAVSSPVFAPALGSDYFNRVGARVVNKSWQYLCQLKRTGNAVAAVTNEYLRVIFFYDRQPVPGTSPTVAQILQNTTATTSSLAFLNMDNRDRFLILRDWHIPLSNTETNTTADPASVAVSGTQPGGYHGYIKLNDLETIFTHASQNIQSGALGILTIGNIAAGSEAFQLVISGRLRYTD